MRRGVFIACLVVVGLCQGCALSWRDAHRKSPPVTMSDCPSRLRSVPDAVGAVAFAFLTAGAYAHRNDADSAANIFVLPLAIPVLAFAASAIYGVIEPGVCERHIADVIEREHEHAEQQARQQRVIRTREQAWARTREAAEAARNGDCTSVRTASDEVRAIDSDFYASVFVRDVAIARCLE